MRSKLALSALVIASLLGATAVASAQTQPAPGASTENNAGTRRHHAQNEVRQNENQQGEIRHHHRDEFQRPQDP